MLAVRAWALLHGRFAPTVDDVAALAQPVLKHRMALGYAARAQNIRLDQVIDEITASATKTSTGAAA